LAFLLVALAVSSCVHDVRIVNGSREPVPTAPMAVEVQQADGSTVVNPQMGPPPVGPVGQRPPTPSTWLPVLLGLAGLIPGLGVAGAVASRLARVKAALGVVVDAVEAAPPEAAKAVKAATANADHTYLNAFVAKRTD
jgi:hypothetical protein